MRLDKHLVINGFCPSREKAQFAIQQKTVLVDGQIVDKPSKEISDEAKVEIIDIFNKYVSKGGLKLEKAIQDFELDFRNSSVLDIGASTGGFTDCALQHGASFVFAVDVGTEQLHESIRNNQCVQFLENKDFRDLTIEETGNRFFSFIVSDISFISLTYIIPFLDPFIDKNSQMIFLIKPQFEAGTSFLNKSGIVMDEKGYKVAIERVVRACLNYGYYLQNLTVSTLWEKNKNVEFLALFTPNVSPFKTNYESLFLKIKNLKKNL
jgi:23S rRNA (cytidine1920-2'-O)/16S rRNA (cytidine1409-2'-O)-methyltransferase